MESAASDAAVSAAADAAAEAGVEPLPEPAFDEDGFPAGATRPERSDDDEAP
jgi:hypothetical protein